MLSLLYGHPQAGSGPASSYLDGVLASTVLDLDATIAASYPGSGTTWANLVTPADGSAKTAYDFYRGDGATSTTYPTFNGSAGSAAAYWSFDGGDYFNLKSGANTAFLRDLHKSTGVWWMAATIRFANVGTFQRFFGTRDTTNGHSTGITNTGGVHYIIERSNTVTASSPAAGTFSVGTDYLVLITSDGTNVNWKYAVNSGTLTEVDLTNAGADANADHVFRLFSDPMSVTNALLSGSRVYSFAMGNEYLDNTKAAAIRTHLATRHARSYGA